MANQSAMLAPTVEESRAQRLQKQQARYRDRGGIFVPSTENPLVEILLSRKFLASPNKKRRKESLSKSRAGSPVRRKTQALASSSKAPTKAETPVGRKATKGVLTKKSKGHDQEARAGASREQKADESGTEDNKKPANKIRTKYKVSESEDGAEPPNPPASNRKGKSKAPCLDSDEEPEEPKKPGKRRRRIADDDDDDAASDYEPKPTRKRSKKTTEGSSTGTKAPKISKKTAKKTEENLEQEAKEGDNVVGDSSTKRPARGKKKIVLEDNDDPSPAIPSKLVTKVRRTKSSVKPDSSKNEDDVDEVQAPPRRPRGRPRIKKSEPDVDNEELELPQEAPAPTRRERGRPKVVKTSEPQSSDHVGRVLPNNIKSALKPIIDDQGPNTDSLPRTANPRKRRRGLVLSDIEEEEEEEPLAVTVYAKSEPKGIVKSIPKSKAAKVKKASVDSDSEGEGILTRKSGSRTQEDATSMSADELGWSEPDVKSSIKKKVISKKVSVLEAKKRLRAPDDDSDVAEEEVQEEDIRRKRARVSDRPGGRPVLTPIFISEASSGKAKSKSKSKSTSTLKGRAKENDKPISKITKKTKVMPFPALRANRGPPQQVLDLLAKSGTRVSSPLAADSDADPIDFLS